MKFPVKKIVGNKVLLRVLDDSFDNKTSLIMPASRDSRRKGELAIGEVALVGRGEETKKGLKPISLKKGDIVHYKMWKYQTLFVDDEKFVVCTPDNILYKT